MSGPGGRWAARKGGGAFVPRAELTPQQQAVLAAVPHWKREWVSVTVKPGQRATGYKVLKWVIDNSAVEQAGTEEEMAAALQVVASGEVAQLPGQATPAGASTEVSTPVPTGDVASGAATPAVAQSDLVPVVPSANKPAEGPAPDQSNPTVQNAVKELQATQSEGLVGGGEADVTMESAKPFVEDQSQLGEKEESQGMIPPVQESVPPAMTS